jgi:outer membrane protein assembly factor BamE
MLLIALAITCITACSAVGFPGVYRIDVEQGNIVTREMIDQLQPGMSKRQVRFILGTPLVEDSFNRNRWDYLYNKRNGLEVLAEESVTITFEGDTLTGVTGDYTPTAFGGGSETEPGAELEAAAAAAGETAEP